MVETAQRLPRARRVIRARLSIGVTCGAFLAAIACGDVPRAASPPLSEAPLAEAGPTLAPDATTLIDASVNDLPPPLPPQLEHRAVRDPGYAPGIARAWKVCVLDTMRDRDLRCGKELLWETEYLPKYRVSDACRAFTSPVAEECAETVTKEVNAALPSADDVSACRDTLDADACDDVAHNLKDPLFANHGGVACTACGRDAKAFTFGTNRLEPVPALDALPFTQATLDFMYARVDAGFGAIAVQECANARGPDACSDLKRIADANPTHPDHASWQQTLARLQPNMDEARWAQANTQRCVQQRDDSDEMECAKVQRYIELFPKGRHVNEAHAALARSTKGRAARGRAAEIESCKQTCASPPIDWGMSPGPANCARILGRPCR